MQTFVAAPNERLGGLGRFGDGLAADGGGEALVEGEVEVAADGVEGDEVVEVEDFGEFNGDLGVGEYGVEDGEAVDVGFVFGRWGGLVVVVGGSAALRRG